MSTITKDTRRELVIAAVDFARDVVNKGWLKKGTGKSQFSNLISVCQQASCPEEVELYIRYQTGRKLWEKDFHTNIVKSIKNAVKGDIYQDSGVAAWRLYSVFLSREYTYQHACLKQNEGNHNGR